MGTGCYRHETEWPKRGTTARRMDAAAARRGRRAGAEDRFEQHLLRGRPALPEALSQHRCRSGGPCRATQIVKHRKHRLVTRLLLSGDWTPSLAQARKMSAPKCNPIASKLVTESQTRRNNKPKRHGGWGTAASREWMNHALASWLPCCAAIRTSSRQGAMRTQRLAYTLRKPTDSREGIGACVACGQCPVEGFRVPSLCEHGTLFAMKPPLAQRARVAQVVYAIWQRT